MSVLGRVKSSQERGSLQQIILFNIMNKSIFLVLIFLFSISLHPLSAQESGKLALSLDELFQLADENNRSLQVKAFDEQLAAEKVQQQKNKMLPSIEASLSFSYNGDGWISDRDFSNGISAPIPDYGNNFAVEATQLIYAGGAVKSSIENAKLGLSISQLAKEGKRQDIRFLIVGYYLELQKIQNQKQILKHNIVQTEKLLEQIQSKYKQGLTLKNSIVRYELQKQSIELAFLKLENAEKVINNELVKALRLPKGSRLQVSQEAGSPIDQMPSSEAWQYLAEQNAPVLKQMELQIQQAANAEIIARSEKLPQVVAFAGDYFNGPIMTEVPPINKNLNYWNVGIGIRFNIANLYKAKSNIRSSKIASRQAMENKAIAQDELNTAIESALIRHQEAKEVYETQLKGVQLATENDRIIRNRYLNDFVLITEMLDAENEKIDAELQAANAQINILYHSYLLKKLSGTL